MVRTFCPVTTSYLPRGSGDHGLTFSAVVPPQLESHLCPQGLGSRFNRAQAQRTNSSGAQPQLLALYLLSKFLTWKMGLLWICGLGPCGLRCPWGLTTISIRSPCSALTPDRQEFATAWKLHVQPFLHPGFCLLILDTPSFSLMSLQQERPVSKRQTSPVIPPGPGRQPHHSFKGRVKAHRKW